MSMLVNINAMLISTILVHILNLFSKQIRTEIFFKMSIKLNINTKIHFVFFFLYKESIFSPVFLHNLNNNEMSHLFLKTNKKSLNIIC